MNLRVRLSLQSQPTPPLTAGIGRLIDLRGLQTSHHKGHIICKGIYMVTLVSMGGSGAESQRILRLHCIYPTSAGCCGWATPPGEGQIKIFWRVSLALWLEIPDLPYPFWSREHWHNVTERCVWQMVRAPSMTMMALRKRCCSTVLEKPLLNKCGCHGRKSFAWKRGIHNDSVCTTHIWSIYRHRKEDLLLLYVAFSWGHKPKVEQNFQDLKCSNVKVRCKISDSVQMPERPSGIPHSSYHEKMQWNPKYLCVPALVSLQLSQY